MHYFYLINKESGLDPSNNVNKRHWMLDMMLLWHCQMLIYCQNYYVSFFLPGWVSKCFTQYKTDTCILNYYHADYNCNGKNQIPVPKAVLESLQRMFKFQEKKNWFCIPHNGFRQSKWISLWHFKLWRQKVKCIAIWHFKLWGAQSVNITMALSSYGSTMSEYHYGMI